MLPSMCTDPNDSRNRKTNRHGTNELRAGYRSMAAERQLPLPGSPEARAQGCTCPTPNFLQNGRAEATPPDRDCPVHGRAAIAGDRAGERGRIDTEGDIVDAASEPELRKG
jgi:hypothetical protein